MKYQLGMAVLVGWTGFIAEATRADVHFTRPAPRGVADCGDWNNACTLDTAIELAQEGDEIWVSMGTYPPIELKDGVRIIGGFAGVEATASQSRPQSYITTIDGGGRETAIVGQLNPSSTLLRGFHIRNGYSNDRGGGMYLYGSNARIVDCIFENNVADYFGGAVAIEVHERVTTCSPNFVNCVFRNNGLGEGNSARPIGGGAVFSYVCRPRFANCLFDANRAAEGGAVLLGDIMDWTDWPRFANCTMTRNDATISYGGAISDSNGTAELTNCVVWGNTAEKEGARGYQIFNGSGGASYALYCDIQGGWVGSTNFDMDPGFVDYEHGDMRLTSGSPCLDAGSTELLPFDSCDIDWDGNTSERLPIDLAGRPRASNLAVDVGAFETRLLRVPAVR